MMAISRPRRQRKSDRLLSPGARADETAIDHAIAPFDRVAAEVERRWGYDKLPSLVPADLAAKYGLAVGLLNEAIEKRDVNAAPQLAENCIKGLAALEAAARQAGHEPPKAITHFEMDGFRFRIIADAGDPNIGDGIPAYTLREVAIALQSQLGKVPDDIRQHFPKAEVTRIKPSKPVDWDLGGDEIPF